MSTREEVIEMAREAGFDPDCPPENSQLFDFYEEWFAHMERFAKLVADKKEAEMQERIDKLHNMYELVCQHRDMLMAQQDAMIAALRGKMQ